MTLDRETFETAVREIWRAEPPPKRNGTQPRPSEDAEREEKRQIESGEETPG